MLARCQGHRRRMVVWPTSAKCFYEIRSNVRPIILGQRRLTHTIFQPTANVDPTLYRHLYDIGSMLARYQDYRRRMVVWPISAKCFYEIRSNVHPIILGQRSYTNLYPTDGRHRPDPLPTSIRHWVNVGSMSGLPSANGYTSDIGPMFL